MTVVDTEDTAETAVPAPAAAAPRKRRTRKPMAKPWFMRLHRWTSVVFGLLILLECVTGTVLLMAPELMKIGQGDRYEVTVSASRLDAKGAFDVVRAERPGMEPVQVRQFSGVWMVRGDDEDGPVDTAFVDPGTGAINDVGPAKPWYLGFVENVHECVLGCDDLPGYVPLMDKTLWGDLEVRSLVLGFLGFLLTFLCISGFVIWWPTIRRFSTGFRVRRSRGSYVRDLDLHKVVGLISLPMLLMWGVSGMNFEWDWPEKAYYAVVPGSAPADDDDPEPGTGKLISYEAAEAMAIALYPDARLVGIDIDNPTEEEGLYEFRFVEGFDLDKYSASPGNVEVKVDSHGGGVVHEGPAEGPVTVKFWADWQDALHFGSLVPWIPRTAFWVVWGLLPVMLGITGITIWLVKWRSRRNRAAARKKRV